MKRILTALAALALIAGSAVPSLAGTLDDIRSRGTVRIGVSLGGEPIGFRDDQNNPVGYDVEVAKLLAEKIGVPFEFTDVSGDARISMLVSGQLDIVVANTSAESVYTALREFGAPLEGLSSADFAQSGKFFRMGRAPLAIDILQEIDGVTFEQAWANRVEATIEPDTGLKAVFISRADLITNKLASGRPQDAADVAALREAAKRKE